MTNRTARGKATGTAADDGPVTLHQAHDVLRRQRPQTMESTSRWRAFYENAARIYTSVAALDGDHHFEALALAGIARDDAEKVGAEKVDHPADGAGKPD